MGGGVNQFNPFALWDSSVFLSQNKVDQISSRLPEVGFLGSMRLNIDRQRKKIIEKNK